MLGLPRLTLPTWMRRERHASAKTPRPRKEKRLSAKQAEALELASILPQYRSFAASDLFRRRVTRATMAFCFVYGFAYALVSPYIIVPFAVPMVIIGLLCMWALPEMGNPPVRPMTFLFWAFLACMILWPNYLAFSLPGLPWITLIRLTTFPMSALLLISLSVSAQFRTRLGAALSALPVLSRLVIAFAVIQLYTCALSPQRGDSIQLFVVHQISWTIIFFISVYVFLQPKSVERFAFLLWGMAIIVGLLGVWEMRLGKTPWADHIPSFLKLQDDSVQRLLVGSARAATGEHRVASTFTTPLGLAEYTALVFPFVLHFASSRYSAVIRGAALVTVPFLFWIVILTDSRLGMVGCLLSGLVFVLIASVRLWQRKKESIIGPAVALSYPLLFVLAIGAVLSVGRLRAKVLGNGATQASTDSRKVQWAMGFPKIAHNPIGTGPGMSGNTLGFANPNGVLTVDSYFLTVLLEYGILGFLVFYGMILYAAYEAGRGAMLKKSDDPDHAFLAPLAIALVNFFVIKSVFSQQDNHAIIFMMFGIIVAIIARSKAAEAKTSPLAKALALNP